MLNQTHSELERIAGDAGWDSFTLLLLVSRWAEENGHSQSLIDHLAGLAADEDDLDSEKQRGD